MAALFDRRIRQAQWKVTLQYVVKNETATAYKLFYSLYNVLQIKTLKYSSIASY